MIVPPVCVRPSVNTTAAGQSKGTIFAVKLQEIVKYNRKIGAMLEAGRNNTRAVEDDLLSQLAMYMDKDVNLTKRPKGKNAEGTGATSAITSPGAWPGGEGQKGRVRWNLCGKRVNFSSRTVITRIPPRHRSAWRADIHSDVPNHSG